MGYKIAIFTLNQWSLDFEGNTKRILESIKRARDVGAMYRSGPELELSGYSLEDAFFESDTTYYCWRCLKEIMEQTNQIEMIIDVGMPVQFGSLYNCRVFIYRGRVLCIRAKTSLANEGIYREYRHFQPWPIESGVVPFEIPNFVSHGIEQYVPFGADFVMELDIGLTGSPPIRIGWDICQELWELKNVSSDLYQNFGCHLVVNSSGSHWELRKLEVVNDMIKGLTVRSGACYAYSNLVGCDGQRTVFYGRSCIYDNGRLVAITPTHSAALFDEVQMITYDIDPVAVDSNRNLLGVKPTISLKAGRYDLRHGSKTSSSISSSSKILHLKFDTRPLAKIIEPTKSLSLNLNHEIRFEDEIHHFAPLWLWDYLRRSGLRGFMMPLSGGLDSSTVATLVFSMCNHLFELLETESVKEFFIRCHSIPEHELRSRLTGPKKLCELILKCCYIATRYSSEATEDRAVSLSHAIGATYQRLSIQEIYELSRKISPSLSSMEGGVTLLEQNLQARLRMTMTYLSSEGNRIVLATGNVDEAIMGYLTKYDCSSADINPIGGLCKNDLKSYLHYCRDEVFRDNRELVDVLELIIAAPPSAELTGEEQRDEDEIGITYDEISVLGKVRRGIFGCSGPKRAFETVWRNRNTPPFSDNIRCLRSGNNRARGDVAAELAELIKRFYKRYAINRHKLTVLTPALHAETYSPDDNRYDHRQFLYPSLTYQFKCIDELVHKIKASSQEI